jgi:hypothetical protein
VGLTQERHRAKPSTETVAPENDEKRPTHTMWRVAMIPIEHDAPMLPTIDCNARRVSQRM